MRIKSPMSIIPSDIAIHIVSVFTQTKFCICLIHYLRLLHPRIGQKFLPADGEFKFRWCCASTNHSEYWIIESEITIRSSGHLGQK
ncbi:hypothetical protein ZOSMA_11G00080 [Zostera marina]|uniref:Uncharacterized protein n=1 Tax=Zostera marina TaxID=29655 RepID=A0A0K9Q389_ZOSMR|nr:hypothetical protein ZOSMA_11G00080 [Zostera marina]